MKLYKKQNSKIINKKLPQRCITDSFTIVNSQNISFKKLSNDTLLFYIEDLFTSDECNEISSMLRDGNGSICKGEIKYDYIIDNLKNILNKVEKYDIEFEKVAEDITHTNSNIPIGIHTDTQLEDYNYKFGIYLNDIENGGTLFYDKDKVILSPNKMGSAFLFHISTAHSSQHFISKINKKLIGFRLKLNILSKIE